MRKPFLFKIFIILLLTFLLAVMIRGIRKVCFDYLSYSESVCSSSDSFFPETEDSELINHPPSESKEGCSLLMHVKITNKKDGSFQFDSLQLTSDDFYCAEVTDNSKTIRTFSFDPKEEYTISPQTVKEEMQIRVRAFEDGRITIKNMGGTGRNLSYYGTLIIQKEEGHVVVQNEVELEHYLYSVVSSEMPSFFPEEARKAQAVCARTFAVLNRNNQDFDDSVSYQVYNNIQITSEAKQAVDETRGLILCRNEEKKTEILPWWETDSCLETIQYYSTACNYENRRGLGGEEAFEAYLNEAPEEEAEYGSAWIRWSADLPWDLIRDHCREISERSFQEGELQPKLFIDDRTDLGQVKRITLSADGERFSVSGEYEIRKVLGDPSVCYTLFDESSVSGLTLLPSAWFFITDSDENSVSVKGGGFGHGRGMSQYGAAALAESGKSFEEILYYYYRE